MTDRPAGSPPPPPGPPPTPTGSRWPSGPGVPMGPPPGARPPGPPSSGWYSGPVPLTGFVARESIGRAVVRSGAKALAAAVMFGVGLGGVFLVGVLVIVALAGGLAPAATDDGLSTAFVAGDEGNRNVLLAIPVTGIILGERTDPPALFDLLDATYGYDVAEKLAAAASRNDIKGVVLEVDTPGGTIFGSRAIADAVADYRTRTGRPVVAFVRGIAASGGMYAMAGADRIVADHGTLIGSIGVIFGPLTHYEGVVATEGGILGGGVVTTGGVTEEFITAGRSKDLGNPYRGLTEEERATLQGNVDAGYREFVDHVATGRELSAETIEKDLGALIFDEQTAVAKGLVDDVGNRDTAYEIAAEAASLDPGNWQVARLEDGPGGLFGLGARSTGSGGGEAAGERGASPNVCARGPLLLAYYGDPTAWCR